MGKGSGRWKGKHPTGGLGPWAAVLGLPLEDFRPDQADLPHPSVPALCPPAGHWGPGPTCFSRNFTLCCQVCSGPRGPMGPAAWLVAAAQPRGQVLLSLGSQLLELLVVGLLRLCCLDLGVEPGHLPAARLPEGCKESCKVCSSPLEAALPSQASGAPVPSACGLDLGFSVNIQPWASSG